jgi:hypothetical protein
MPIQARPILPATIAALAVSLFLSTLAVSTLPAVGAPVRAAEACLAAPKGAAPQGSHWYYRVDQNSQRKCWRLVQQDRKNPRAAAQATSGGDADDTDEPAASPPAKKSAGRLTAPQSTETQSAVSQSAESQPAAPEAMVTKDASAGTKDTSDANGATQAVQWPDPPTSMMERLADPAGAPVPSTPAANDAQAPASDPAPIAEPAVQQPVTAADNAAPVSVAGGSSALQFVFAVIAFLGLLTSAIFYISGLRSRRTDVLDKAQHLNALPTEVPVATGEPTFAPLPPMNLMSEHDDVEEAMRRFTERWKRRAAA